VSTARSSRRYQKIRARSAAGVAGFCASLGCVAALATDYEFNPRVELSAGYDNNVNLVSVSSDKISSADGMVDARADLIARESNWQWRLTPEVNGTWYPDHTEIDSNGELLYLYGERNGPRYTLELNGYAWSQSLLRNYLPTSAIGAGLGVAEQGTTLVSLTDARQNLGYIDPRYTLQVTQRERIEIEANYTDSSYNKNQLDAFTDYHNLAGSAGLVYQATPTGSLTLRARAQQFKPDFGLTTDTYGGELQWDGKLSPNKQYYLRVGAERSSFSGSVVPVAGEAPISNVPASTSVIGGAGAQWTWQVTELFIDGLRDVEPTGLGYAVARSQLRLRLERRFTQRLAGFIGGRLIYDDPVNENVLANTVHQTHYNYGTTGFEWRFTRQFTMTGAYEFTSFHSGQTGASNAVRLSLIYEPNRPANGPAITVGY
jgi:hypothetical protein